MDVQEHNPHILLGDAGPAASVQLGARGLTLVELMVTLVVILIVIASASTAYLKLFASFKVQDKISDTQMDTLVGLEFLRYDIEMAGYGLPQSLGSATYSSEAASSASYTLNPSSLNDSLGVPRAFAFRDNNGTNNSDVVAIKSTIANVSDTTKKWSMIYQDGGIWKVKQWDTSDQNFASGERVIVIDDNRPRALCGIGANWSPYVFASGYYTNATGLPLPTAINRINLVYGIDPDTNPRMPFNRVDYYLATPSDSSSFPSRCFSGSYILYRAIIRQSDGTRGPQPLIDCVRDFQMAFGLDTDGDGGVDTWLRGLGSMTPDQIRAQVREVRVFILYQEGQRDDNFQFSGILNLGDEQISNNATFQALSTTVQAGALSTYTPAGDALKYRWKIAKLVIKPMNIE